MKKVINIIISMLLCACLIINTSNFRRDTYAFVPVVVAEGVLVSLFLTAMGIYTTEFLSTDEGQELCRDIAVYLEQEYAEWDNVVARAASPALGYCSIPVDYFTDTCNYILDYFQTKQPQLFPSYVPPSAVNGTYTSETVKDTMCSIIAEACANNFKDGFSSEDYYNYIYNVPTIDRYFRSYIEDCTSFDVYLNYSWYFLKSGIFKDTGSKRLVVVFLFSSSSGKVYLRQFACLVPIPVGTSCFNNAPNASMKEFDNISLALANTVLTYESTENSSFSSVPVSQLIHTATYTNTTVAGDVDVPAVDVPQDIVNLDTDDNAITNPDYITNVVNNYTTVVEGENVIPLHYPSYADTQNVIVDGLQDLTRTDVLDGSAKVGVQPVNETVSTVQGAVTVSNIADITHAVSSAINYGDGNLNVKDFKMDKDLTTVFPFCIPFDVIRVFNVLKADPVAPIFEFDFTTLPVFDEVPEQYHDNMVFKLDMRDYDDFVKVVRVFVFLSFVLFLIIKTRDLVRG